MVVDSNSGRSVLQPLGVLVVSNVLELGHPKDVSVLGDATDHLGGGHEGVVDELGTLGVQCLGQ